jgi:selenocysteine lyase/cysteine desulfurase
MGPKGTGFVYINKDKSSVIQPVQREDGVRFVIGSTGVGSLPLVVGLGAACEAMSKRGMATVEKRVIQLRDRAYEGLKKISKIQLVSPPPGPLTSALVSFVLPDSINGNALREQLAKKYRIVVKIIPKKQFNGNRISPHIFNSEEDIDAVIKAIRTELT